ncbi:MAG: SpoIID/LytB domain-containing protein [Peptostreptococcaceae bacterium]|nr:SpoIID/LytB domain-containing protein [Peptostreptococcaceae bacterium]
MSLKRYFNLFLFLLLFNMLFIIDSFASESMIKVGLNFSNTALKELELSSEDDLIIVFDDDEIEFDEDEVKAFYDEEKILILENEYDEYDDILDDDDLEDLNYFLIFKDGELKVACEKKYDDDLEDLDLDYDKEEFKGIYIENDDYLFAYDDSFDGYITSDDKEPIKFNGRKYRGNFILKANEDEKINVINYLNIDEYLYGVLPPEMPITWPKEALKVQAISSRNYALRSLDNHKAQGFDICATTHCQVYKGLEAEKEITNEVVDDTKGLVMTYDGKIVKSFYHSSSGGVTEASKDLWSEDIGYLQSVRDEFSLNNPYNIWQISYSDEEIEDLLEKNNIDIGRLEDINILKRSESNRVKELEFEGSEDDYVLKKGAIRKFFGYTKLKSTLFSFDEDDDIFEEIEDYESNIDEDYDKDVDEDEFYSINGYGDKIEIEDDYYIVNYDNEIIKRSKEDTNLNGKKKIEISKTKTNKKEKNIKSYKKTLTRAKKKDYVITGKGYGHGVGLSQWGAREMALRGYNYKQILKHYYKGIEIEKEY